MNTVTAAIASFAPSDIALVYQSMQPVDSYHFYTIAAAAGVTDSGEVPPASALVIEVHDDKSIKAYYNDIEFQLTQYPKADPASIC